MKSFWYRLHKHVQWVCDPSCSFVFAGVTLSHSSVTGILTGVYGEYEERRFKTIIAQSHCLLTCTKLCTKFLSGELRPAFTHQRYSCIYSCSGQHAHLCFTISRHAVSPHGNRNRLHYYGVLYQHALVKQADCAVSGIVGNTVCSVSLSMNAFLDNMRWCACQKPVTTVCV